MSIAASSNCNKMASSTSNGQTKTSKRTLLKAILDRTIYGCNAVKDNRLIRVMLESRTRKFTKVFEINDKSHIHYLGDRLYLNSFKTCISVNNPVQTNPRVLYSIKGSQSASVLRRGKIEEILQYEHPLDEDTFCKVKGSFYARGPYLIGLTADNYLKTYDFNTGKVLQEYYLHQVAKFKYLKWETVHERIAVISTQMPQHTARHLLESHDHVFVFIAIFSINPLELVCMLSISRNVFGPNVTKATVWNGSLLVLYRGQEVQLFSLEDIIANHTIPVKLGDQLHPGHKLWRPDYAKSSAIIGKPHFGIPVNVRLLEKPVVLFHVSNPSFNISFGGFPWHYVMNGGKVIHVRALGDNSPVQTGSFKMDTTLTFGMESAFFLTESSATMLFITPLYLRCFKLSKCNVDIGCQLREQFTLDYRPQEKEKKTMQTSSGRKVKELFTKKEMQTGLEILQDFDYDDELAIIAVLHLDTERDGQCVVSFYDMNTGRHVSSVEVDDMIEDQGHAIAIDREIMIIMSKRYNDNRCLVYRLC